MRVFNSDFAYAHMGMIVAGSNVLFNGDLATVNTMSGKITAKSAYGQIITGSPQYCLFVGYDLERSNQHGYDIFKFKLNGSGYGEYFWMNTNSSGLLEFKLIKDNQPVLQQMYQMETVRIYTQPIKQLRAEITYPQEESVLNPYYIPYANLMKYEELIERKQEVNNLMNFVKNSRNG